MTPPFCPTRRRRGRSPSPGSGSASRRWSPRYTRRPVKSTVETPRGEQGQAVRRGRRGRVRPRHRRGVPQDRPRGPPARASAPARRRAQVLEARIGLGAGPRAGAARRHPAATWPRPCASTTSTSSPRPRSRSPAARRTGPVAFDATCEVRPDVIVPGYGGLRVELPSIAVHRRGRRRGRRRRAAPPRRAHRRRPPGRRRRLRHPRPRRRPATASRSPGSTPRTGSYEVGQGWVADGLRRPADRRHRPATSSTFTADADGTEEPADFAVAVKKVQELVLPELTDEWVGENLGEFETVDEWRAAIRERIGDGQAQPGPPAMLDRAHHGGAGRAGRRSSRPRRWSTPSCSSGSQNTVQQLQAQGIDHRAVAGGHRPGAGHVHRGPAGAVATQAVKVDLALRAVADAEEHRGRRRRPRGRVRSASRCRSARRPTQVRKAYERNDAVPDLQRADPQVARRSTGCSPRRDRRPRGPAHRPRRCCCRPTRSWWPASTTTTATTHDHDHDHDHDGHDHDHDDDHDHDHHPTDEADEPLMEPDAELPRPHRRRADQPGRAGLRPLQPAAQGEHHLPAARRSTTRSPT